MSRDPFRRIDFLRRHGLPPTWLVAYQHERSEGRTEPEAIALMMAIAMEAAESHLVALLREDHWPHAAHWVEQRIAEEIAAGGRP